MMENIIYTVIFDNGTHKATFETFEDFKSRLNKDLLNYGTKEDQLAFYNCSNIGYRLTMEEVTIRIDFWDFKAHNEFKNEFKGFIDSEAPIVHKYVKHLINDSKGLILRDMEAFFLKEGLDQGKLEKTYKDFFRTVKF